MLQQYELHAYASGTAVHAAVTTVALVSDQAAKARAGRLSKTVDGPVDLARAGTTEWYDRYLTTASPSKHHATGYRFERLT